MNEIQVQEYLQKLKTALLNNANWKKVVLTTEWVKTIPSGSGVYVFKNRGGSIVYVGETGSLRGRMNDLFDSRHHTVRRSIGKRFYSECEGFALASTKKKFPAHIEELVNNHICNEMYFAFLTINLGRKELEELIDSEIQRDIRLNQRGKRTVKR